MHPSETIEHFLATGEVDPAFPAWEGSLRERRAQGTAVLDDVLRRVVRWRSRRAPLKPTPPPADVPAALRQRLAPMAHGLLSPALADAFLTAVPRRFEVVTVDTFLAGLRGGSLEQHWILANMLLDDMGAPPLADDAPQLDGFCEDGRAWVTARAFTGARGWVDPIVHEGAHLLHEPGILHRRAAPLLPLSADRCEVLAYGCELWACILDKGGDPAAHIARIDRDRPVGDPRIDHAELIGILHQAAAAPDRAWRCIAARAADTGDDLAAR